MSKIVGIDFGTKNVGIAISDESRTIAKRLDTIPLLKNRKLVEEVARRLKNEDIELIIVGSPLGLDAKPTKTSKLASDFATSLSSILDIGFREWNETYTSQDAEKNISDDKKIHMEAARIILQGYLDFLNSGI